MVVLSSLIRGNVTREGTTRELVRRRRARLVSPRIPRVSDAPEGTTKLLQSKRLGTAALAPLVLSPAGAALAAASENPPAALAQPEAVGLTLQQVIQIAVENPWATLAVCGVLAYAIPKLLEKFLLPIVAVGLLLVGITHPETTLALLSFIVSFVNDHPVFVTLAGILFLGLTVAPSAFVVGGLGLLAYILVDSSAPGQVSSFFQPVVSGWERTAEVAKRVACLPSFITGIPSRAVNDALSFFQGDSDDDGKAPAASTAPPLKAARAPAAIGAPSPTVKAEDLAAAAAALATMADRPPPPGPSAASPSTAEQPQRPAGSAVEPLGAASRGRQAIADWAEAERKAQADVRERVLQRLEKQRREAPPPPPPPPPAAARPQLPAAPPQPFVLARSQAAAERALPKEATVSRQPQAEAKAEAPRSAGKAAARAEAEAARVGASRRGAEAAGSRGEEAAAGGGAPSAAVGTGRTAAGKKGDRGADDGCAPDIDGKVRAWKCRRVATVVTSSSD